jgi:hypothetical protein
LACRREHTERGDRRCYTPELELGHPIDLFTRGYVSKADSIRARARGQELGSAAPAALRRAQLAGYRCQTPPSNPSRLVEQTIIQGWHRHRPDAGARTDLDDAPLKKPALPTEKAAVEWDLRPAGCHFFPEGSSWIVQPLASESRAGAPGVNV